MLLLITVSTNNRKLYSWWGHALPVAIWAISSRRAVLIRLLLPLAATQLASPAELHNIKSVADAVARVSCKFSGASLY